MDKDEVKQIINEALYSFKEELETSILKATIERNTKLIEAVKSDHSDINLESLIRDYLNIGDLGDISVNYSFIQNRRLKKQLTIDNLQMEKYRLGLVNGAPDFIGFCKYAHFQIEGLVSYFIYKKVGGDFEEFKKQFPEVIIHNATLLSELSHSQKNYAFGGCYFKYCKENNLFNEYKTRKEVENIRNQYSHRSFVSIKDEFSDNYSEIKSDSEISGSEEEREKAKKEFETLKFITAEDFTKVRKSIQDIATYIKQDLKK